MPSLPAWRLFVAVLFAASCANPVHSDAVDALGPERRGVRQGPNHRPGQPCRTCHGGQGPAAAELAVAGTIYSTRGIREPVSGVLIVVRDARGDERTAVSNEVGNFFVGSESWQPVYPLSVRLEDGRAENGKGIAMQTLIGRNGDCATCHYGEDDDPRHMPPVYLRATPLPTR